MFILTRLKNKIIIENNCWIWNGAKNNWGYGFSSIKGKAITAHRLSYIFHKGVVPNNKEIHHICNNKLCINPEHLISVTKKEHGKLGLKTHCKRGHEFTEENTWKYKGKRWCRICNKIRQRKHIKGS